MKNMFIYSIMTGLFSLLTACTPEVSISSSFLPADGISSGTLSARHRTFFLKNEVSGPFGNNKAISVTGIREDDDRYIVNYTSTGVPGRVHFTVNSEPYYVTFYNPWLDSDSDGFPDPVELDNETDRLAFRNWFVRIAQAQYLKRNAGWQDAQRDCSGLIRYACREALKIHDEQWYARSGIAVDKNLPDVSKFNYPALPLLRERLFRVKDLNEKPEKAFSTFCDAGTLIAYNVHRIGTDIKEAETGDILFFRINRGGMQQYHSMIIVETRPAVYVVYHTGVDDVMKRVPLGYLDDAGPFRPVAWNKRFLGIYRFNILE